MQYISLVLLYSTYNVCGVKGLATPANIYEVKIINAAVESLSTSHAGP